MEYWFVHPSRDPANVPGPFYTLGTCLACGLPEMEAPTLLALLTDKSDKTYFIKQPVTAAEVVAACAALQVCCVDDLRYGGNDPKIIAMLGNSPKWCDHILP